MEYSVITTYRCNAHCQMCNIWRNPSRIEEEITLEIIDKLPAGQKQVNITGGEPMLRRDIEDIVAVLHKKTSRLLIISNGYFTDKIINIARNFPDITVRISVEGLPKLNDEIRGIKNGFDHALRTVLRLKALGLKDIGFAITVSDRNIEDLLDLYHLSAGMDLEFTTSAKHNSFYFFKNDNKIENMELVTEEMGNLIKAMLNSKRKNRHLRIKDWFRAYLNLVLLDNMRGEILHFPCGAATDRFFLDPYGKILACNGSEEPWIMGNLKESDFDQIWNSEQARKIRDRVGKCNRNCGMPHTVAPSMRKGIWIPIFWVIKSKFRLVLRRNLWLG